MQFARPKAIVDLKFMLNAFKVSNNPYNKLKNCLHLGVFQIQSQNTT